MKKELIHLLVPSDILEHFDYEHDEEISGCFVNVGVHIVGKVI